MKSQPIFHVSLFLFLVLAPFAEGQTFEILHSFQPNEGDFPSGLVEGSDGLLYGVTASGGEFGAGTIYKITTNGHLTTLYSFTHTNGANPVGRLVQGKNGHWYGTTAEGGINEFGTVFQLDEKGSLTTLVFFNLTNGSNPRAGLMLGNDGNFYGTTAGDSPYNPYDDDGPHRHGTIFQITHNGIFATLHSFAFTNGAMPYGRLLQGNDGRIFGTTGTGGETALPAGTIFSLTTNNVLTTLYLFEGLGHSLSGLIEATDGNFYGSSEWQVFGSIFKFNASGILTPITIFQGTNGAFPTGELIQGNDGYLYGMTQGVGTQYPGTIFKVDFDGNLSTLVSLDGEDGSNASFPFGGLLQAKDGHLYGTTAVGGMYNRGTVFRIVLPAALNFQVINHELVLSWPTNAVGFTLRSTANLNFSNDWDFIVAPAVVGNQFIVTNSISESAKFYRLWKP